MSKIPTIQELDEQHCKMCDSQMSTNIKQFFNEMMLSYMERKNIGEYIKLYTINGNGCNYSLYDKNVIEALDNEVQQYGYVYNSYYNLIVLDDKSIYFKNGIQERTERNKTFCNDFFKSISGIQPTISEYQLPIIKNIQMNDKCQMSDFVQYMNKTYPSLNFSNNKQQLVGVILPPYLLNQKSNKDL